MTKRTTRNLALLALSALVGVGLAEGVARVFAPDGYHVLVPGMDRTFHPDSLLTPGVRGPARYRVNAWGVRGPDFGPDSGELRILAVGGSTTECAYLDEDEAWTGLLSDALPGTTDGRSVWSGNVGRSGLNARDHAVQMKYLPGELPRVDIYVALVGANDVLRMLAAGDAYARPAPVTDPRAESRQLGRAFLFVPGHRRAELSPWYRATALWQLARRARFELSARRSPALQDDTGEMMRRWREARARGRRIESAPAALDEALAEYRSNLETMVRAARGAGSEIVLVTQPSLWRPDNTPAELERLWMGGLGGFPREPSEAYYTEAVLHDVMRAFNEELLSVCEAFGLACVDAAALLPSDTSVLYDDVHFTELGSRRLAEEIVRVLTTLEVNGARLRAGGPEA